jgi:cytochrome oxidase assembly protein ShyY1
VSLGLKCDGTEMRTGRKETERVKMLLGGIWCRYVLTCHNSAGVGVWQLQRLSRSSDNATYWANREPGFGFWQLQRPFHSELLGPRDLLVQGALETFCR